MLQCHNWFIQTSLAKYTTHEQSFAINKLREKFTHKCTIEMVRKAQCETVKKKIIRIS